MSNYYEVKHSICDICNYDWSSIVYQEILKEKTDWFTKHKITNRPILNKDFNEQYYELTSKKRARYIQPCFYFIADCGGDAISICGTCITHICSEIMNYEK